MNGSPNGHAENFGARMTRIKRERGIPLGGPGRRRLVDKHGQYVNAAEEVFAKAMPDEARRYLAELAPKEPEHCPEHGRILGCPVQGCETISQRVPYDHAAAKYIFDRIMGRPTSRSENALTVQFVQTIASAFSEAFVDVNDIPDPHERREAFAQRLMLLGEQYNAN